MLLNGESSCVGTIDPVADIIIDASWRMGHEMEWSDPALKTNTTVTAARCK